MVSSPDLLKYLALILPKFSLQSFRKQVQKLTETQKNSITQVGFGHLLHIPYHILRRSQLIDLVETWSIERQAFIFPSIDITITLLDVALILGLHVIGPPVVLKDDTPLTSLEVEFGASDLNRSISLKSLKERIETIGERADSCFVRVFLLYCFGTLLFPNENGRVDSRYLLFLDDLDNVSSFAWGAAVKQDLHDSLTQCNSHRTSNVRGYLILLQVFNTKFSLQSFLKQVNKLTEAQRNSITQVGFGHLLQIPSHVLRRSQLEELMDTWSIERQAFIFPLGDISITLLDVVLILGLRVIGQPIVLKQDTPITSLEIEFGASDLNRSISLESLKERLETIGERADSSFVRVFLLYCFGTLLFPSGNGKVDSKYLLLLEDLDNVSSFAWGEAVKEDLQDSLTQFKSKRSSNVRGCLILLQIWCYEHIVIGRPKLLDCPSTFPRVGRWESSGRQYLPIKFEELVHSQILWRLEPTSEEIQIDIIKEIPHEWYLRNGLGTMEEPIYIESGIKMARVQKEEQKDEEPMSHQKSTVFVLSDDDESKLMEDLKEENFELKARVEELSKEKEVMKKENEIMKKENEELRMLVEKLQSDKAKMENSVSDIERILSEYSLEDL